MINRRYEKMACVSQPPGPHWVDQTISRIAEADSRLIASASALSDDQLREPSLLPGWSRGHVLTHVARNAGGLANLLTWARTGIETPQYASFEARNAQIEDGSGRPAAEIIADVSRSSQEFIALAGEMPGQGWLAEVRAMRGPAHPAWYALCRRLIEVEVHHVDLAAGYAPEDWPAWFIADMLDDVVRRLADEPNSLSAVLTDTVTGRQLILSPDAAPELAVSGPGHLLLAWLIGRDDGAGLSIDPSGPLPEVPPF
jgi:maleylpyruvate isomerase